MIRVLLVDDEPAVIKVLKTKIPWERFGMQIAGDAANGLKALDFLKKNPVDLVVTDIKMPHMDGNALIKEISSHYKKTRVVALSSYSDYNLVKSAFKGGAADYMLKEDLGSDAMFSILESIKQHFEKEHSPLSLLNENRQSLAEYLSGSAGSFLAARLEGYFSVLVYKASGTEQCDQGFEQRLAGAVEGALGAEMSSFYLKAAGYHTFLLNMNTPRSYREHFQQLFKTAAAGLQAAAGGTGSFAAGVSRTDLFLKVRELFNEARQAVELSFYNGFDKVYTFNDLVEPDSTLTGRLPGMKSEFAKAVRVFDFRRISEVLEQFFSVLAALKLPKEMLMPLVSEMFNYFCVHMYDSSFYNFHKDVSGEDGYALRKEFRSFEEMKAWLLKMVEEARVSCLNAGRIAENCKSYINNNYSKDLSLSSVAEYLNISESYLSRIFARDIGINFNTYLNNIRIEKAKILLANTSLKLGDIAEKTGYKSIEHFCRTFKRVTNITPGEFRSRD